MYSRPIANFITFTTYGTWLHGDSRGSIIKSEGSTKLSRQIDGLQGYHKRKLVNEPVILCSKQRKLVLEGIVEHCEFKGWKLYAVHVRSNHIHIIVCAEKEQIVKDLKSWGTRKLRAGGYNIPKVWTQGGSRQYIFEQGELRKKIDYVIHQQGKMMEYYVCDFF